MTIKEYCVQELEANFVWPDQAEQIMAIAMADDESNTLRPLVGRWNEQVDGFPSMMMAICNASLRRIALEWLNKNHPNHIAIQMLNA